MNKKLEKILNKIDDAVDIARRELEATNKLILKYRPITKLTNKEITEACVKFFDIAENEIFGIRRIDKPIKQVNIKVGLNDETAIWTCIRDPFDSCPYFEDKKKRYQYFQWCLAHGVCCWLKDNPYLEGN